MSKPNPFHEVDKDFFKYMDSIDSLLNNKDVQDTHFKLTILHGKAPVEFESVSNLFTTPMKAALKNLKSGDHLYFEYINGKDKNGSVVRLDPLNYLIK
ncbi:MAG: hypothetical protein ABI723_08040 [Bacteroidia bacterium]